MLHFSDLWSLIYILYLGDCKLGKACAYKHEKNGDFQNLEMKMEELEKKSNEKDDALKTKFNDLIEKIKERWNNKKDKILKLYHEHCIYLQVLLTFCQNWMKYIYTGVPKKCE